ncbi:MAG: diacylglycerol kinase family protein [Candidatus Binatia bacterium]|nr:diacylglycerol kinase family protein [Candidatus Binatia bacterium]
MAGIGVIVNPHAGRNQAWREVAERLDEAVQGKGFVLVPHTLEALQDAAIRCAQEKVDIVAICGGDGSFFRGLSALARVYGAQQLPLFLPLRGGSMNTIARSVGVRRGTPPKVLAHVVEAYASGRPLRTTERQLLRIHEDHYGFMVGCGVIVNFLQVYYGGKRRGPQAAALWLARVIGSGLVGGELARRILQGFRADVVCDGERVPHRNYNVLYASTITDIGLGFVATYLATRKAGYFHLLAGQVRASHVISRLHRLRAGCPMNIPELYDNIAQDVRVEFEWPTHYTIDGDILEAASQLRLRAGPRLTIVQE